MIKASLTILLFITAQILNAATVEDILALKEAPDGVVYEIVSKPDSLTTHLPKIRADIVKLRSKFPDLQVAVVTHGSEQFALTKANKNNFSQAHSVAEALVKEDGVNVHICETHASWRDISAEDFPDFVQVSESGPVQVHDYVQLGYVLVEIFN